MTQEAKSLQFALGEVVGHFFSFSLFTTVLFFVLTWTKHLPAHWGVLHVMGIVVEILLLGYIVGRWLK